MNFNFFFTTDALLNEELVNVASVVSLQLDYSSPLRVLVGGAIAAPSLLEELQDFLQI